MTAPLPPLRDVIDRHGLAAKKTLGQHFLLDLNITRKIVRLAGVAASDTVLEVGPGPGGLTRALLETGAAVIAVERDQRCLAALEELAAAYPDTLDLVEADALAVDERALAAGRMPVKIVANLPYNISSVLLAKWLHANCANAPPLWTGMTLMFQKEVAQRIVAAPGGKAYGRLSVLAQAASAPRRAFDLPARAFTPPPKVDSSVVLFDPSTDGFRDCTGLEKVTRSAFSQRRKMVRKSLRGAFGDRLEAALAGAEIELTARAEDIPVEKYKVLARVLDD